MNLTQHFTLDEMTSSESAQRRGIDNTPSQDVVEQLKRTAGLMEQVRSLLAHPIWVTSGYRSSALNNAIGGKPTSKHVQGLACDFKCPAYGTPEEICRTIAASDIKFDQLILEFNSWVHIGLGSGMRMQVLTINEHGTYAGIHP